MYIIKYSGFAKQWLVINKNTGLAQSGWKQQIDAMRAALDLNRR